MLLEFKISNYRSIAEEQVVSMLPSMRKSRTSTTGSNYYPDALTVAAIYGPNGAGKSNFVRASRFLGHLISESGNFSSNHKIQYDYHFLDKELAGKPGGFEITFTAWGDVWRYGVYIANYKIHQEFLIKRNSKAGSRERTIFRREGEEVEIHKSLNEYENLLKRQTNGNQLFLTKLDQNNDKITKEAYQWLDLYWRSIQKVDSFPQHTTVNFIKKNQEKADEVVNFMNSASIKVDGIRIEEKELDLAPDKLEAYKTLFNVDDADVSKTQDEVSFKLKGRDDTLVDIKFVEESRGTREFFKLAGPIIDTLKFGFTLIIDELNASFHTELQKHILELFLSHETNPKGAQLIFTTHDTNIMRQLERDEIWLAEKQANGATAYSNISDFGTVHSGGSRRKEAFEKRYLEGRYGALPEIDFFESAKSIQRSFKETSTSD